jgi:hypothetical protein
MNLPECLFSQLILSLLASSTTIFRHAITNSVHSFLNRLRLVELFGYLKVIDVTNVPTPNPVLVFSVLHRLLYGNG